MQSPEAERNGPSKELLDRLRAEEVGKDHFTYIVLTLRDQHVEVNLGERFDLFLFDPFGIIIIAVTSASVSFELSCLKTCLLAEGTM